MVKRCADCLTDTVSKIKQKMIESGLGHFDETGTRVDKKLHELTGINENHPGQKWASAFIDLLLEIKKVKDKAVEKGKDSQSYYLSRRDFHPLNIIPFAGRAKASGIAVAYFN